MAYEQKPGITGNTSYGGEYTNLDTVDSLQYDTIAADSAAAASLSATAAAASAASALTSANNADTSEANALSSATSAAASAASALTSSNNADTSEANALASANTATSAATSASTSAATATIQADIATTKASEASVSANSALTSANTATTQAGIATTQASSATTSAASASTSATNALTSANNASTSESNALTSATNAAASAVSASSSAASALTSANNSAASASSASISAANALTSESNAATSAGNAASSANSAQSSATSASNSATAAAASAAEAATTLANKLDKNNNLSELTNVATARTNLGLGTAAILNVGVANGIAELDAGGTVPLAQLPSSIKGGVTYQGTWNASTNTPTITSGVGSKGHYYVVSVAGSTNIDSITDWVPGDWIIFNGTVWEQIDNTDAVSSVNGYTGAVSLTYTDVGAASTAQGTLADSAIQPEDISSMAYQSSSSVNITGGTLTGVTLDDVNALVGADHIHFKVKATENIAKGDPVRFVGYNNGENAIEVAKISSVGQVVIGLAHDTLTSGSFGAIVNTGVLRDINTSTYAEGTILYPAIGGGLTSVKPTSGYYQAVAFVLRSNTNNGKLLIEASEPQLVLGTAATNNTNDFDLAGTAVAMSIALG